MPDRPRWIYEYRLDDGESPELARKLRDYQPPFEPTLRDWFPRQTWPWLAALAVLIVIAAIKAL